MAVIAPFLQRQLYDEAVTEMADGLRRNTSLGDSSDSDANEHVVKPGGAGAVPQGWSIAQADQDAQVASRRNVECLRRRKRSGAPTDSEKVNAWLMRSTDWGQQFQRTPPSAGYGRGSLKRSSRPQAGVVARVLGSAPGAGRHVVSRDFGGWWLRVNLRGKLESLFPVVSPNTKSRMVWDVAIMSCVLYSAVTVPLAFSYGLPNSLVLAAVEWTITALYIMDIGVCFRTAYFDEDGNMVRDSWPVARRYLATWFTLDLVATLPYDAIGVACGLNGDTQSQLIILAFLKTPRLLRLIKLMRLLDRLRNANLFKVLQLVLLMMLIAHWLACIWFIIARYAPSYERWGFEELQHNRLTWYLCAFYYSFLLLIGDNIAAYNNYERVFFIFSLVAGACFYSAVVGNMALLVANMNTVAVRFRTKLDMTQDALRYMRVPKTQQKRVQAFYDYLTMFNHPGSEGLGFLSELSKGVNEDVHMFLHFDTLRSIYLFQDCEPAFIQSLGMRMKIVTFIPKEIIFRQGDLGHEMYIIRRGCVAVVNQKNEVMSLLQAGDFFGEIALLTQARRTAQCVALSHIDLAILNSFDLKVLMKEFPASATRVQAAARERLRQLQIAGRAATTPNDDSEYDPSEDDPSEAHEAEAGAPQQVAAQPQDPQQAADSDSVWKPRPQLASPNRLHHTHPSSQEGLSGDGEPEQGEARNARVWIPSMDTPRTPGLPPKFPGVVKAASESDSGTGSGVAPHYAAAFGSVTCASPTLLPDQLPGALNLSKYATPGGPPGSAETNRVSAYSSRSSTDGPYDRASVDTLSNDDSVRWLLCKGKPKAAPHSTVGPESPLDRALPSAASAGMVPSGGHEAADPCSGVNGAGAGGATMAGPVAEGLAAEPLGSLITSDDPTLFTWLAKPLDGTSRGCANPCTFGSLEECDRTLLRAPASTRMSTPHAAASSQRSLRDSPWPEAARTDRDCRADLRRGVPQGRLVGPRRSSVATAKLQASAGPIPRWPEHDTLCDCGAMAGCCTSCRGDGCTMPATPWQQGLAAGRSAGPVTEAVEPGITSPGARRSTAVQISLRAAPTVAIASTAAGEAAGGSLAAPGAASSRTVSVAVEFTAPKRIGHRSRSPGSRPDDLASLGSETAAAAPSLCSSRRSSLAETYGSTSQHGRPSNSPLNSMLGHHPPSEGTESARGRANQMPYNVAASSYASALVATAASVAANAQAHVQVARPIVPDAQGPYCMRPAGTSLRTAGNVIVPNADGPCFVRGTPPTNWRHSGGSGGTLHTSECEAPRTGSGRPAVFDPAEGSSASGGNLNSSLRSGVGMGHQPSDCGGSTNDRAGNGNGPNRQGSESVANALVVTAATVATLNSTAGPTMLGPIRTDLGLDAAGADSSSTRPMGSPRRRARTPNTPEGPGGLPTPTPCPCTAASPATSYTSYGAGDPEAVCVLAALRPPDLAAAVALAGSCASAEMSTQGSIVVKRSAAARRAEAGLLVDTDSSLRESQEAIGVATLVMAPGALPPTPYYIPAGGRVTGRSTLEYDASYHSNMDGSSKSPQRNWTTIDLAAYAPPGYDESLRSERNRPPPASDEAEAPATREGGRGYLGVQTADDTPLPPLDWIGATRSGGLRTRRDRQTSATGVAPPRLVLPAPSAGGGAGMGFGAPGGGVPGSSPQAASPLGNLLRLESELIRREADLVRREEDLQRREAELGRLKAEAARGMSEAFARKQELITQLERGHAVHAVVLGLVATLSDLTARVEELSDRLEDTDTAVGRLEHQRTSVHGGADFLGLKPPLSPASSADAGVGLLERVVSFDKRGGGGGGGASGGVFIAGGGVGGGGRSEKRSVSGQQVTSPAGRRSSLTMLLYGDGMLMGAKVPLELTAGAPGERSVRNGGRGALGGFTEVLGGTPIGSNRLRRASVTRDAPSGSLTEMLASAPSSASKARRASVHREDTAAGSPAEGSTGVVLGRSRSRRGSVSRNSVDSGLHGVPPSGDSVPRRPSAMRENMSDSFMEALGSPPMLGATRLHRGSLTREANAGGPAEAEATGGGPAPAAGSKAQRISLDRDFPSLGRTLTSSTSQAASPVVEETRPGSEPSARSRRLGSFSVVTQSLHLNFLRQTTPVQAATAAAGARSSGAGGGGLVGALLGRSTSGVWRKPSTSVRAATGTVSGEDNPRDLPVVGRASSEIKAGETV